MKSQNGKALENLVAAIENILCADGKFEVVRNHKLFYKRTPFAEFDVIVRGKAGSNPVLALIECRDRRKRAPNEWIHALRGKREFHRFTSVAAVSTSGFSKGCEKVAADGGIELRKVASLAPDEILPWFPNLAWNGLNRLIDVRHATIHFVPGTDQAVQEAARVMLSNPEATKGKHFELPGHPRLSLRDCFNLYVGQDIQRLVQHFDLSGDGSNAYVRYPTPAILQMTTVAGIGRIGAIRYFYDIITTPTDAVPLVSQKYLSESTGETISETVSFDVAVPGGRKILSLHKVPHGEGSVLGVTFSDPVSSPGSP